MRSVLAGSGFNSGDTGFTRMLFSAAEKDGKRIIAVTLNDPNDWEDHRKLLDLGFSSLKVEDIRGLTVSLPVVGSDERIKVVTPKKEICVSKDKTVGERIIVPAFLYLPVKKGDVIGYTEYYVGEEVYLKEKIVSETDIKYKKDTFKSLWLIFSEIFRCINEG